MGKRLHGSLRLDWSWDKSKAPKRPQRVALSTPAGSRAPALRSGRPGDQLPCLLPPELSCRRWASACKLLWLLWLCFWGPPSRVFLASERDEKNGVFLPFSSMPWAHWQPSLDFIPSLNQAWLTHTLIHAASKRNTEK